MTQKELQEWFEELEKLIKKHPRQWDTFKRTSKHIENVSCISCIYGSQSKEQLNENHRFSIAMNPGRCAVCFIKTEASL